MKKVAKKIPQHKKIHELLFKPNDILDRKSQFDHYDAYKKILIKEIKKEGLKDWSYKFLVLEDDYRYSEHNPNEEMTWFYDIAESYYEKHIDVAKIWREALK